MGEAIHRLRRKAERAARGKGPTAMRYPAAFRAAVLAQPRPVHARGVPVRRIARRLGLPSRCLGRWLAQPAAPALRPVTVALAPPPAPSPSLTRSSRTDARPRRTRGRQSAWGNASAYGRTMSAAGPRVPSSGGSSLSAAYGTSLRAELEKRDAVHFVSNLLADFLNSLMFMQPCLNLPQPIFLDVEPLNFVNAITDMPHNFAKHPRLLAFFLVDYAARTLVRFVH